MNTQMEELNKAFEAAEREEKQEEKARRSSAIAAMFRALLPKPPVKSKNQIKREAAGTEPVAYAVVSRHAVSIATLAVEQQAKNERLNLSLRRHHRRCTNLKKLRHAIRQAIATA